MHRAELAQLEEAHLARLAQAEAEASSKAICARAAQVRTRH